MTTAFDSVAAFVLEAKASRAQEREEARKVVAQMSAAMVEEKGLLNHAQAALVLGVSVKRIGELVRNGKLKRFDYFDRTYVSMREVCARDDEEMKAGTAPKRSKVKRVVDSVRAGLLKSDSLQISQGGYAGPYHEAQKQKRIATRKGSVGEKE